MQSSSPPDVEYGSIEDLFTLGLFSDAYRAGEAEILRRLSEKGLPRALLPPRLPLPGTTGTSSSKDSRKSNGAQLAHSTPERAPQSASGIGATPLVNSAPPTASAHSASSNSSQTSSRSQTSSTHNTFIPESGKSSGLASSSAPAAPPKPREINFDQLAATDQLKLKSLVFDSVPILAVMMQCLFELQLADQIVPLLLPLCGPRPEEYPFELAFLIVNLHVTTKNYTQARKTCETLLSDLRSQLGPLPLKIPYKLQQDDNSRKSDTLDSSVEEVDPSSPSKTSSSSSSSQPASLSDEDNEFELDEEEPIVTLRHRLMSLLQLYIFHILCPLHQYADAKSYLFTEARIHPKVLQEWIFYVDEAEKSHIEETRRSDELRKSQTLPVNTVPRPDSNPVPIQPNNANTPTHSSKSWWSALLGEGEFGDDQEQSGTIPSGSSPQVALSNAPIHVRIFRGLMRIYSYVEKRYQHLTPAGKQALHILLSVAAAALLFLIYSSKWYKKLELRKFLARRFSIARNLLVGAPAPAPSHRLLAQLGPSRGLLGSGTPGPSFR